MIFEKYQNFSMGFVRAFSVSFACSQLLWDNFLDNANETDILLPLGCPINMGLIWVA